jgi:hypothetical protein
MMDCCFGRSAAFYRWHCKPLQNTLQELAGALVCRGVEHDLWRCDFQDFSLEHEYHPVGNLAGKAHLV